MVDSAHLRTVFNFKEYLKGLVSCLADLPIGCDMEESRPLYSLVKFHVILFLLIFMPSIYLPYEWNYILFMNKLLCIRLNLYFLNKKMC